MSENSLHAALPSNLSPIDSTGQKVISETTEPGTWNCVQASKQQPTLKAPANLSLDAGGDLYFWVTRDQSLLDTHPRFIHWLKRLLELRKPIYLLDEQLLQRIFSGTLRVRYEGKRPHSPMPSPGMLISQSSTSLPIPKCTKQGGGLYEHHPWAWWVPWPLVPLPTGKSRGVIRNQSLPWFPLQPVNLKVFSQITT